MRIWACDRSPTVLYSGGVPNGEQRLSQAVQTVWWFVFLSKLWSLCMQSSGTLVLQTRIHRADKDPIVQIEERNMENFKPVSRQRPEKAKQGADRPYCLHKSAIFEQNWRPFWKLFWIWVIYADIRIRTCHFCIPCATGCYYFWPPKFENKHKFSSDLKAMKNAGKPWRIQRVSTSQLTWSKSKSYNLLNHLSVRLMGALVLIFQSNMLVTTLCHRNPDFKKWKIAALLHPP